MRRLSSPLVIRERREESSHGLMPASTSALRFALTLVASVVLIVLSSFGWMTGPPRMVPQDGRYHSE